MDLLDKREKRILVMVRCECVEVSDSMALLSQDSGPLVCKRGLAAAPRAVESENRVVVKGADQLREMLSELSVVEEIRLVEPV